jgi:PAS domain S-box-containing protein
MARTDVAAFLLSLDGAIMSWGAGAESLFGFSADELLGRRVSQLVPPDQSSGFTRILHVVAQGQRIDAVQTLARKDGTRLEVALVCSPARNGGGQVTGARAVAHDVTAEVAEDARGRLDALLESIPDAVYTLDRRGVIRTWSPGAERLYGYAAHEAVGLAGVSLVPSHRHEDATMAVECVLAGEPVQLFETEARRKDSVLIPISLNLWPVRDRRGQVSGVSVIARDLAEERLVLAALAESEVRLRESESLAQVGGWVWDVGTGAVQWSEQLHRIHGLDPADFAGTLEAHLEAVHPGDRDRVRAEMADAVRTSHQFESDYRIVRADGQVRLLHGRAEVALDPADSVAVAGLRGIAQDVTDRSTAQQDVRSRVGGELRAALDTIMRAGRFLEQSGIGAAQAQRAAEIMRAARHLLAILDAPDSSTAAADRRGP